MLAGVFDLVAGYLAACLPVTSLPIATWTLLPLVLVLMLMLAARVVVEVVVLSLGTGVCICFGVGEGVILRASILTKSWNEENKKSDTNLYRLEQDMVSPWTRVYFSEFINKWIVSRMSYTINNQYLHFVRFSSTWLHRCAGRGTAGDSKSSCLCHSTLGQPCRGFRLFFLLPAQSDTYGNVLDFHDAHWLVHILRLVLKL